MLKGAVWGAAVGALTGAGMGEGPLRLVRKNSSPLARITRTPCANWTKLRGSHCTFRPLQTWKDNKSKTFKSVQ